MSSSEDLIKSRLYEYVGAIERLNAKLKIHSDEPGALWNSDIDEIDTIVGDIDDYTQSFLKCIARYQNRGR